MDVSGQFSVLLILSVVGLLLNRLVYLVRRRVLFWDPSEKSAVEVPEGEAVARTPLAASAARPRNAPHEIARRTAARRRLLRLAAAARRRPDHQAADRHLRAHDHRRPRRAVRGGHQDGLVQGGRDRDRDRAAARLDRLREDDRHQGSPGGAAERGAAGHPAAAGREGQVLLHGVPDQHLRHRRAGRQPHPEARRPQGQDDRRHQHVVGRRDHRAGPGRGGRAQPRHRHHDRGGRARGRSRRSC